MNNISMFIPCVADLLLPEIGEATLHLLRRLGLNPIYHEKQTCCGEPAINAGYNRRAKKAAKHFIRIFENDEVIVCPSGSCVNTVKNHYPDLLCGEPEWLNRAEKLASRVYELSQYLVDILHVEDVGAVFNGKVTYHESCNLLRGLGVSEQPKKLLRAVRGTELVPLHGADICCGFGGEFSVNYPAISEAIVKEKADNFINSGADILVLAEPGCLLNIRGYLDRNHPEKKVLHIANFLVSTE